MPELSPARPPSHPLVITQKSGTHGPTEKRSSLMTKSAKQPPRLMGVVVKGVLPPDDTELEFNELHSVIEAQEELAANVPADSHAHVEVVQDDEIEREVLELSGKPAVVTFATRAFLKQLVFYLKQTPNFFSIEIEVVDQTRKVKTFVITNHKSSIRIDRERCVLPVPLVKGWKYTRLDLADLTEKAFGTRFVFAKQIRVHGGLRLYRIFFQDKQYSDAELPAWLRVISQKPY